MSARGLSVTVACIALGVPWALAASWRARGGTLLRTVRVVLGGIIAAELAWVVYGLGEIAGVPVRSECIEGTGWRGLGFAGFIGLAEEGAKLAGAAFVVPSEPGSRRDRLRVVLAVSAVFATAEAVLMLRGASWPVTLGRAAFAPVAHALLAVPIALALAASVGTSFVGAGIRVAAALALAAALHGLGDWSILRPGLGRLGFAMTLLVPAMWLYARGRWGRRGALVRA